MTVFTLDGVEFNVSITSLKRKFAVTDTENSGRTIDGNMHRDIIGTYYNYIMEIETKDLDLSDYDLLYEMLSAPVDSHMLTVPYAQKTLTFKAYVNGGQDDLKIRKTKQIWNGLSVDFIAMEPQRRP